MTTTRWPAWLLLQDDAGCLLYSAGWTTMVSTVTEQISDDLSDQDVKNCQNRLIENSHSGRESAPRTPAPGRRHLRRLKSMHYTSTVSTVLMARMLEMVALLPQGQLCGYGAAADERMRTLVAGQRREVRVGKIVN